jgi:adenylate kinase
MDFILFGIQGSGKGTQGKILAEKMNCAYFEMGGALRKLAQEPSELGQKVKATIEAGKLVSDELVIEIVANFLSQISTEQGIVFDGIPRKEKQRSMLEELLQKNNREPVGIYIEIPEDEAKRRLTNRWMSKSTGKIYMSKELGLKECDESDLYQRADDNEESVKVRLAAYRDETLPVINWYKEQNRLITVNGTAPIPEVTVLIDKAVEDFQAK